MEPTAETFIIQFFVPPQLLLREDWESMCHDHALAQAHAQGVIPVGPSHIDTEKVAPGSQLTPGVPLAVNPLAGEVVRVTVTFMVGAKT